MFKVVLAQPLPTLSTDPDGNVFKAPNDSVPRSISKVPEYVLAPDITTVPEFEFLLINK